MSDCSHISLGTLSMTGGDISSSSPSGPFRFRRVQRDGLTYLQSLPPCDRPNCPHRERQRAVLRCGVCLLANYCSVECHKSHIQEHLPSCKLFRPQNGSGSSPDLSLPPPHTVPFEILTLIPEENPENPEYLTFLYDRIRHYSDPECYEQLSRYAATGHLLSNLYLFAVISRGSCFGKANVMKGRNFSKPYKDILETEDKDDDRFGASIHFIRGVYYDDIMEDHEKSFRYYTKAALGGHVSGMVSLGFAHATGQGCPVDNREAMRLYQAAADRGHGISMSNLGGCYFFGLDVPEDRCEGIRWYKRSADTGNAFGMFNYANCRLHGHGCLQNANEAVTYYKYAAEQNFDGAATNLGTIYQRGFATVKPDYMETYKWFKRGSEAGNVDCMNGLGCCYLQGLGVPRDRGEAHRLWRITASRGSLWSANRLRHASSIEFLLDENLFPELTSSLSVSEVGPAVMPQYLFSRNKFFEILDESDESLKANFELSLLMFLFDCDISVVAIGKDIFRHLMEF